MNYPSSLDWAVRNAENSMELSSLIKTHVSDVDYPWPPGKAPWPEERGSTGVAPEGARENFGKTKLDTKYSRFQDDVVLPKPSTLREPRDQNETNAYLALAERLLALSLGSSDRGQVAYHRMSNILAIHQASANQNLLPSSNRAPEAANQERAEAGKVQGVRGQVKREACTAHVQDSADDKRDIKKRRANEETEY